jgi:DNA polymerase III subunit gamma/tau
MGLDTKHRPKNFDDVIGQDVATTILRSSVIKNMFNSAYLFEGPSGVGKTTIARIFAKAILCYSHINGNPCGVCESCKLFEEEKNFGYTELDAASVGGKDDMIKLKDDAAFISVEKKKIILLDECHDISKQGQDALLKQVEQCPPHLIYLFCTTESNKIRPTLRKRCTQFQFSRVIPDLIFNRLKYICEIEKISFDEEALKVISDRSEGHVRDALKLLEEADQFGSVSLESVSKISVDYSADIFEVLANLGSNLPHALEISKKISSYISVSDFYEQLVSMVCDAVKVIYGYEDFLPKRKEILIKLRDIHGCLLIEFMNYLITREKFIDKIGLTSDLILLHYKFCSGGFKPQIPETKITQENNTAQVQDLPIQEQAKPSISPTVKHAQLMSLPMSDRLKLLQQQHSKSQKSSEKEDTQKVPFEWSLPKEERSGSDSSMLTHKELSPLDFSRLLVGGRGGG